MTRELKTPFDDAVVESLRVGDQVLLSGMVFTARDAAHQRLCGLIAAGRELPVELLGQVIYFTGPTPAKPGYPIGSAGPTTSYRMDDYSPILMAESGLKGMIGKGGRGAAVVEAMRKHKCVYFAATGGAGALIARHVKAAEIVCYDDLGPEAIHRLELTRLPLVVAIDCRGGDLYRRR